MVSREAILHYIDKHDQLNTLTYASSISEDHQKVVGVIKSLQGIGQLIQCQQVAARSWELTSEGRDVASHGSHEAKVFHAVPADGGIDQSQLMASLPPGGKIGFSKAVSCGWLSLEKCSSTGSARVVRKVRTVTDVIQHHLRALDANPAAEVSDKLKLEYKKRKLLHEITVKSYDVQRGSEFTLNIEKAETDLTADMISSGAWRHKTFKPYNFDAMGANVTRGQLHPLLKVRAEFRQIFLEMGFSEMPTNRFVESSFWNFDALFQPQQHPARDAQDTFFVANPATSCQFPTDYVARVKRVHSVGGYGSCGYASPWHLRDAQKNVLRTHTTAVSARMLYQLAQQKEFKPVRYFSIDRVFRNETLDATHLAEFHQIEGVVADRGLTLGHLMGVINEFFGRLGIESVRFKPAYNPYTEPSMEIFSWHPGLSRWVEVGNSGMFRPEMLLPMNLPPDVNVIAWGLSLERPTMIKYKLDNIRDLCGHRVNLQMVADNPICRLDKPEGGGVRADESPVDRLLHRQDVLSSRFSSLQLMVDEVREQLDLAPTSGPNDSTLPPPPLHAVLDADPRRPPHAVFMLCRLLAVCEPRFTMSIHVHSSCDRQRPPPQLLPVAASVSGDTPVSLQLTVVWKSAEAVVASDGHAATKLRVGRVARLHVHGEAAVCRLLARRLDVWRCRVGGARFYDECAAVDVWLDAADAVTTGVCLQRLVSSVEQRVLHGGCLAGSAATLADVFVWSILKQHDSVTQPLAVWAHNISQLA